MIIYPAWLTRYCRHCGFKMEVRPLWYFDPETGEATFQQAAFKCPNKKHWWDKHDKYIYPESDGDQ